MANDGSSKSHKRLQHMKLFVQRGYGLYHLLCMRPQQLCPPRTHQYDYIPTLLRSHLQQHSICVQLTAPKKLMYLLCIRPSQKGFGCANGSCQRAVKSVLPLPWQFSPAVNPTAQTYEESHTEDGLQSPTRKADQVDATAPSIMPGVAQQASPAQADSALLPRTPTLVGSVALSSDMIDSTPLYAKRHMYFSLQMVPDS